MTAPIKKHITNYPPSALRTYCEARIITNGATLADCRRHIEEMLERKISSTLFYRWLNNTVRVPEEVKTFCRMTALPFALKKHGLIGDDALPYVFLPVVDDIS